MTQNNKSKTMNLNLNLTKDQLEIIDDVMDNYLENDSMFTSLDITNEVNKKDKSIKYNQVNSLIKALYKGNADYLDIEEIFNRSPFEDYDYIRTLITVKLKDQTERKAFLYHRYGADINLYSKDKRQQTLQSNDELKFFNKNNILFSFIKEVDGFLFEIKEMFKVLMQK